MNREEFYHFMWEFYELYDEKEILEREIAVRQPFIQRMIDKGFGELIFEVLKDRQELNITYCQDN